MCNSTSRALAIALLGVLSCGKPASARWPGETSDPAVLEARRLLTEAGYEFGKGFPKLTILYNEGADYHRTIAAALQEMWRKSLGIQIELVNKEWKVYLDQLNRSDFDIARRGYTGEYADPHSLLSLFTSDSFFNSTGWRSEAYDRLIADSDREPDRTRRLALLAQAERLLLDEGPMFPIYHATAHNLVKPFVHGVHLNPRDLHPLQHVWIEGPGAPEDGVLVFNGGSEPASIDPALSFDIAGLKVLMHLMEGLVVYDPVDAQPIPGIAERWDLSADGRTYTFHLRPARWSNGDEVTAHDFVYAWRRVVDPKSASPYAHRMYVVKNGREINRGAADPATLGVRALDDRTFEVTLVERTPYFLQLICLNLFMPVHRATVERHGREWTKPANYVGNGPYRLVTWKMNDRKDFEKNPRYHSADRVKLAKFTFLAVEKPETAFRLYEEGTCHWLFSVPVSQIPALKGRRDYRHNPYNNTYFYVFNLARKPLDDLRVRKALRLTVDVKKIVASLLAGVEIPASRLTPPLYPEYKLD